MPQQPLLTSDELRDTRDELLRRLGEAYDNGTTRRALLAVEELITLRERILACAVSGEPLVKPLPDPPISAPPPSGPTLLTEAQ